MRFEVIVPREVGAGEPVPIRLVLANTGEHSVTLYLAGRPIAFDVIVENDRGEVVWRRLEGAVVSMILQVRELAPGATLEFTDVWEQRTNDGRPVPPGHYRITGSLPTDAAPLTTAPAPLRIRPARGG